MGMPGIKEMSGIKVGDRVRAVGGEASPVNGVVVQISANKGFLVADLDARVEPEWYTLSSLQKQ